MKIRNLIPLLSCASAIAQTSALPKAASGYKVSLTWQAPTVSLDPVVSYDTFRAPHGSSSFAQLNATKITTTTYLDINVQAATTYDYIVESVDAEGVSSAPSNTATVSLPGLGTSAKLGTLTATS